jgi:hypothetical protein
MSLSTDGASPIVFSANGSEIARFDSAGCLSLGNTTNPGNGTKINLTTTNYCCLNITGIGSTSNSLDIIVNSGGTVYGGLTATGSAGTGYIKFGSYNNVNYAEEKINAYCSTFTISGALSKGSGSFRIDHPLPSLNKTHDLVHSFIEGPQADLIYSGKVSLVAGTSSVNIDTVSTMTEGTFVLLCRNVRCFTTNESDWTPIKGSVSGNTLTIVAQDNTSTATISWMVIGERQDKHMYDTEWTDDNGKVKVETLRLMPTHDPEVEKAARHAPTEPK